MDTDYSLVLTYRYPGKKWRMGDFDYSTLEWLDESPRPTRAKLDSLWPGVQADLIAEQAALAESRASAETKLAELGLTVAEIQAILP
jgi:hypothetical protein